jgi:hypothetical protein
MSLAFSQKDLPMGTRMPKAIPSRAAVVAVLLLLFSSATLCPCFMKVVGSIPTVPTILACLGGGG